MERTFLTEAELSAFAADFARSLRPGDVVGLWGPLGAGKTSFVRAAVRALHGSEQISSPTFTFWHRYAGVPPVDHLDLYRLEDPRDLAELGLEEAFDGSSVVLVEWWRNAPGLLPPRHYEIEIQGIGDGPRSLRVSTP
jgi:tRNA threonylcarbamoyladenosine biosynthesis protein TsaE